MSTNHGSEPQPEWIEIIDPKSKQRMFANLVSGHCAWEPPPGVPVKRMQENQWWELYDAKSARSYYYNPMTTVTIWNRPTTGDIIPLARLQRLQQNTNYSGSSVVSVGYGSGPIGLDTYTNHHRSQSSTSTPRAFRRTPEDSMRIPEDDPQEFGQFVCTDLSHQLNDVHFVDSGIQPDQQSTSSSIRKVRAPSSCSSRSTRSRFNNCIQEMSMSHCPEQQRGFNKFATMNPAMTKDVIAASGSYSPTSSVSSCGQSYDTPLQSSVTPSTTGGARDSFIRVAVAKQQHQQPSASSTPVPPADPSEAWAKDAPKYALLDPADKKLRKYSNAVFKLISSYMGDRKTKTNYEDIVLAILEQRSKSPLITDEVFLLLMKQLTDNPKKESTRRGWELMGILLFFFVPSNSEVHLKVLRFVEGYCDSLFYTSEVVVYAKHCLKRLQLPINSLKPSTAAVSQARFHIFNPSKFGTSLDELMEIESRVHPTLTVPWIENTLIRLIIESGGPQTEGLFRIAADPEQLSAAMAQLDQNIPPVLKDPHVAAVLLKQWLRQLPSPLIPDTLYAKCLQVGTQPENACAVVDLLPAINRLVLVKLLHLLQDLSREEVVKTTKMDVSNLALVMAPNILRCDSQDPEVIFANSRKEMQFMKTLITSYDTSFDGPLYQE